MNALTTRIHVHRVGSTTQVRLASGLLAPRLVRQGATTVEVALVATGATLLGGDHVRVDLRAAEGTTLVVRDIAGTVAYAGGGRTSRWDNVLRVEAGGRLVWHTEPFVLSDEAQVARSLRADVAGGGRLLLRDTIVLGRAGQAGGALTCSTRVEYDDRAALAEDLVLDNRSRDLPGMIDEHVLDTATAVGWHPTHGGPAPILNLANGGSMSRSIVADAHRSPIHDVWRTWAAQVETP